MSLAPTIECPACGLAVPLGTPVCPQDGTPLLIEQIEPSQPSAPVLPTPLPMPTPTRSNNEPTILKDPMIGAMLGEYRVDQRIGLGGMGLVYRGVHPVIGKPVAVKVLRPEVSANPSHVERLLAEARAVNAIRHRGIIDIFNFGQTRDGRQYLVMEFLDGLSLDQYISKHGAIPAPEAVGILEEVCSALAAAHGAGVIHRDLKPNNIFIVEQGFSQKYVKLLDFGLAKQGLPPGGTTPQTQIGLVVGTPEYIAPEQARGENVGPLTDLYSLGVVAFQTLTGRLPFEASSPMDYVVKHLEHEPALVVDYVPSVPRELSELVSDLLAKAPADRPGSAEEVRRALKRIARMLPQEVTEVGSLPTIPRGRAPIAPAPRAAHPRHNSAPRRPAQLGLAPVAPLPPAPPPSKMAGEVTVLTEAPEPTGVPTSMVSVRAHSLARAGIVLTVMGVLGAGAALLWKQARGPVAVPVEESHGVDAVPDPPQEAAAPAEPPTPAPSPELPEVAEAPPAPTPAPDPPPPEKPIAVTVTPVPKASPTRVAKLAVVRAKKVREDRLTTEQLKSRIEALEERYTALPDPSKYAVVPLKQKLNSLQGSPPPEELRAISAWLDRWEKQFLGSSP